MITEFTKYQNNITKSFRPFNLPKNQTTNPTTAEQ